LAQADANPEHVISMSLEELTADLGPLAKRFLGEAKADQVAAQPRLAHG
jgi:hypothetical protein